MLNQFFKIDLQFNDLIIYILQLRGQKASWLKKNEEERYDDPKRETD